MRIYFKEVTFRDYSRVGYDSISISCSLYPYGSEEGHDSTSTWYFIEISDSYTKEEAIKLARAAILKAQDSFISVSEALSTLTNGRRRRKRT